MSEEDKQTILRKLLCGATVTIELAWFKKTVTLDFPVMLTPNVTFIASDGTKVTIVPKEDKDETSKDTITET